MEQILLEAVLRHMEDREVIRDSQPGFTKGKSCHSVSFYDGVVTSADKKRATGVICLDFYNAFDTVLRIFLSKSGRHGYDGSTVWSEIGWMVTSKG